MDSRLARYNATVAKQKAHAHSGLVRLYYTGVHDGYISAADAIDRANLTTIDKFDDLVFAISETSDNAVESAYNWGLRYAVHDMVRSVERERILTYCK